ncbi:hypothetical protein ACJRO7_002401 [Eucalyptus globulus]|uniref:Uncharacterized protein n=1 Tax=Eucalyptus globulus TaxID=34317 RepID=A0ABD3LZV3_EUCGL
MVAAGLRSFGSFAVAFVAAVLLMAAAASAQASEPAPAPAPMESGAAFAPASLAVIGSSVALSLLALRKY